MKRPRSRCSIVFLVLLLPVHLVMYSSCDEAPAPVPPDTDCIQVEAGADLSNIYRDRGAPARIDSAWVKGDSLHIAFWDVNCTKALSAVAPTRFVPGGPPRLPVYVSWEFQDGACLLIVIHGTRTFCASPAENLYRAREGLNGPFDLILVYENYEGVPESTVVRHPGH